MPRNSLEKRAVRSPDGRYGRAPLSENPPSAPANIKLMTTRGRGTEGPREFELPRGTRCLGTLCRTREKGAV